MCHEHTEVTEASLSRSELRDPSASQHSSSCTEQYSSGKVLPFCNWISMGILGVQFLPIALQIASQSTLRPSRDLLLSFHCSAWRLHSVTLIQFMQKVSKPLKTDTYHNIGRPQSPNIVIVGQVWSRPALYSCSKASADTALWLSALCCLLCAQGLLQTLPLRGSLQRCRSLLPG